MAPVKSYTDAENSIMTIRLGNKDFQLSREAWDVKNLKLDPKNQRISYKVQTNAGIATTDKELHEILWSQDTVKTLFLSIKQNGGLIEDPIIRADGTVIEGNCRTVALRELIKKDPSSKKFNRIYVQVLPDQISDEDLMLLLGELHIAGRIQWQAYEQAEYIYKMNKQYGYNYEYLTNLLRWSKSKITQKISAYEETKRYLASTGDKQGIRIFSHFEEFMKKKQLRDMRKDDEGFMEKFSGWVNKGKFKDAKHIRDLPRILENEDALAEFESKGYQDALRILFNLDPSLESNLYSKVDAASHELETISIQEIDFLKNGDKARTVKIKRLKDAVARLESFSDISF